MSHLPAGRARIARPNLLFGLALAVALAVALIAHRTSAAHAAEPPPCTPKQTRIAGKKAVENCGPATVALTVGGHVYHYTHGLCSDSKSAGAKLELDMGTLVVGASGNAGEPYFSMLIADSSIGGSVFEADFGGKQVLGDSLITPSGKMKGTFEGTDLSSATRFSGSWNCHGVIWHAP